MQKCLLIVCLVLGCLCCWNCDRSDQVRQPGQLYIVTTTGMITDAVRNVVGDRAIVQGLMAPGVDPHLYKITASDTHKLANADIIFYNGLHLEGKMSAVLHKISRTKPVHAIAADIPLDRLIKVDPEHDIFDPHIWFDVSLWNLAVQKIARVMIEVDPKNKTIYEANSYAYQKKLEELHEWTKGQIASIPAQRRILITAHDAFGYFGQAYKIEVIGLQGISTAAEYGIQDVERIVNLLIAKQIPAIFVETSVSSKAMEAVIQGCASRNARITIGGNLFSDAMGTENTPEGNYIGMVRHNVLQIATALK